MIVRVVRVPTLCLLPGYRSACSPHMQVTDIVKQVIQWLDSVVMLGIADRHICAPKQTKLINVNIKHNSECSSVQSVGNTLSSSSLIFVCLLSKSCNYID